MCAQHAISFTYDLTLQGKYVISMCKYVYSDCTVLHICIETGYTHQSKPHMHVYIYAHYEYEATVFMSKNTALNNSRLLVKIT